MPGDGGFGKDPVQPPPTAAACGASATFRGDGGFNVPSLVAAAATPPFFHNNGAATLEEAITFYTSDTFNASPAGNGKAFALDAQTIRADRGVPARRQCLRERRPGRRAHRRGLDPTGGRAGRASTSRCVRSTMRSRYSRSRSRPVFAATGRGRRPCADARDKLRSGQPGTARAGQGRPGARALLDGE